MPQKRHNPHHRHHRSERHNRHGGPVRPAVSPSDLIREDYQRMLFTMRLRTTESARELILMQSVEGHAQMGHGAFAGRRFPNTEMEEVVEALARDPRAVGLQRQALIDEVASWVESALAGEPRDTLVNEEGQGLIGCGLLRHLTVSPPDVLRGLYLGGLRDHTDLRREVEQRTGARIGGGRCHFVDIEVMHRLGLDCDQLARSAHEHEIEAFRREGLIVADPGPDSRDDRIRYLYLRDRVGGGASDDAAIIAAGKLHGLSAALGVFLADAIDTLEKFVVDYADQDYELARHIEGSFADLKLSRDDLHRLVWLCSVPPEQQSHVPDSSLRHLLEIDRETDETALESHLAYLSGHPYSPLLLASEDVPNRRFYEWFEGRMKECPI